MNARPRYFTPAEVAVHNTLKDLWISFLGKVYNLTPLCESNSGSVLLKPIVAVGGKDISHWFDRKSKDIRYHVDAKTKCYMPHVPMGRFIHIPPPCPRTDWANDFGRPWWKDDKYCIGILSSRTRKIRIVNTLTSQEQVLEVCSEETMNEILQRYLVYNAHAASYTWKYNGNNLDMNKSLQENNVMDESEDFYELGLDEDQYLPAIHIYFNDDLTEL